jgi:hypothetical protein
MSRRHRGKLAPFIALFRHTVKSPAWKALSVGARATFFVLKSNYNTNAQNAVFLSSRDGAKELGVHKDTSRKWLHELERYGFIVEVQTAYRAGAGVGKAAHYRLTDCHFAGQAPTYDFQNWDGTLYDPKKQNPGLKNRTPRPKKPDIRTESQMDEIGNKCPTEPDIRTEGECPTDPTITSFTSSQANSRRKVGAEVVPLRRRPSSKPQLIEVSESERSELLKILAQIPAPIPRRLAR